MEYMTTTDDSLAARPRRRHWTWLALLLPLLAADTKGLHSGMIPGLLMLGSASIVLLAPRTAAKLSPFACFAMAGYGFWLFHLVQNSIVMPVIYGVVKVGPDENVSWLVPQAVAFLAAGVVLLAVTDAPGGAGVRRAWWQLRGTHGQPKTVPALLLLPVIFLFEELFSGQYWFPMPWFGLGPQLVAVSLAAAAVLLVVLRPRAAATVAVAGLVTLGLAGIALGLGLALPALGLPSPGLMAWLGPWDGLAAAPYGAVPVHVFAQSWPGQLPAAAQDGLVVRFLAGFQGLALLGVGVKLAPRLLTWAGDAELARRAQALTRRVTRLTETRSDAAEVAVAELRRIERDLHDGAQARLVAVGMSLRAAEHLLTADPEAALTLVAEARETSSRALDDLRGLVRGIYPPVLADRGLADAIRALALDTPVNVDSEITLRGEPPMPVAAAVYFAVAEALTNATRHAAAEMIRVSVAHADGMLRATVTDDGHGGADPAAGTGLAGVERRLATFDGILALSSPPGGPTIVIIEVPCTLAAQAQPSAQARSGLAATAQEPDWRAITPER
jgi:signal transduction histidine kinase